MTPSAITHGKVIMRSDKQRSADAIRIGRGIGGGVVEKGPKMVYGTPLCGRVL